MINNKLKQTLDELKNKIKHEINVDYEPSYNDVISFLKNYYYQPKRIVNPLDGKVRIVIPLRKVSPISVVKKLDS